jgi:uncharacterized membrane-anchored protein
MADDKGEWLYVVTLVQSGIPVLAEAYRDWDTAATRHQLLQEAANPERDTVGISEVEVNAQEEGYP